jgi:uncharacterized protein with von Willebrand factor type A (vWA) domain
MLSLHAEALHARCAERLTGFAGFLHANGFSVGGADAVQVLETAQRVGMLDPHVLRWSLQALLCGRGDEWRRFDELFDAWFLPANRWQRPERRDAGAGTLHGASPDASDAGHAADDDADELRPRDVASRQEILASTDFQSLTEREHSIDIEG